MALNVCTTPRRSAGVAIGNKRFGLESHRLSAAFIRAASGSGPAERDTSATRSPARLTARRPGPRGLRFCDSRPSRRRSLRFCAPPARRLAPAGTLGSALVGPRHRAHTWRQCPWRAFFRLLLGKPSGQAQGGDGRHGIAGGSALLTTQNLPDRPVEYFRMIPSQTCKDQRQLPWSPSRVNRLNKRRRHQSIDSPREDLVFRRIAA